MRSTPSFVCASLLFALVGCGGGSTPSTPSPYLNLNGNWEAIGISANPSQSLLATPIAAFMGALHSSSGNVTGTLRALDTNFLSPCVPYTQDLAANGTLSAAGNLVLTVPISSGTATLTAALTSNLQTYTTGSWTIVGGPCAMPSTSMAITQYAPVTGTYTGTLTNFGTTNNSTTITASLTQTSTPNADGQFPLAGTVSATGACTGSFPLTTEYVSGNGIFTESGNFQSPLALLSGPILPPATSIQTSLSLTGSSTCTVGQLSGTLTRQ
jgi:hypothetical protein